MQWKQIAPLQTPLPKWEQPMPFGQVFEKPIQFWKKQTRFWKKGSDSEGIDSDFATT